MNTESATSVHPTIPASERLGYDQSSPDHLVAAGEPERAPFLTQLLSLLAVVIPFLGVLAAIILLWGVGFDWTHLFLLIGGYLLTAVGITVGYHRLFTHKSFRTGRILTAIFGVLGSMAVEGPILRWVATHRSHHQYSDRDDDPHSPHTHGQGLRGFLAGLYHSHFGWFFVKDRPGLDRYVPDLKADRLVRGISALFPLWVLLGLLIPAGIAWGVTGTWTGALLGLIWGGLVRVFFVHHVTWSINSVCHLWGSRPYRTHDHSRNNPIFGVLGLGEGWHNNHHAFPASARHGLSWWEFDASYLLIRALAALGLVHDVRVPSPERLAIRRVRRSRNDGSTPL
jgi:stearoyl-CoA desaturase (delta-9 desaturase)